MSPENKYLSLRSISKDTLSPLTESEKIFVPIEAPRGSIFSFLSGSYLKGYDTETNKAYQRAIQGLEKNLSEKGLLGEHELLSKANVHRGLFADLEGEWGLKGFFFLVFGGVKGKGKTEGVARTVSSIQFAWKPNENENDILISEIPIDKIVFKENPSLKNPHVSFQFTPHKLVELSAEDRGFFVSNFSHPNDYLKGDRLAKAVFTISSAEDLKELPFPKET